MPPKTIEEWMKDHVRPAVHPILRYLPRDHEGIRLTQCAIVAALGWVGLLCLAWCGSGCGGEAFSTLEQVPDTGPPLTFDAPAIPDAGTSETTTVEASVPETESSATEASAADTGAIDADANICVLAQSYDCGPNGMGGGKDWWGTPPQTFCVVTNNQQRYSMPVPAGCNACETFNCGCIAATELCRGMTCSDQGGRVFVTCGM
jgi:hypothetical protein